MRPMMEAFAEANNHEQGIVIGSSQAKRNRRPQYGGCCGRYQQSQVIPSVKRFLP